MNLPTRCSCGRELDEGWCCAVCDNDEDGVGNWMIAWERAMRIAHRIACPELDYPASEAKYSTVEEWEKDHNIKWLDFLQP